LNALLNVDPLLLVDVLLLLQEHVGEGGVFDARGDLHLELGKDVRIGTDVLVEEAVGILVGEGGADLRDSESHGFDGREDTLAIRRGGGALHGVRRAQW
jgi:hypothetical protein